MTNPTPLYEACSRATSTHVMLRWRGRLRFVVPIDSAEQQAARQVFKPGYLGDILHMKGIISCGLGVNLCKESPAMEIVRNSIGTDLGSSCWRAGAASPWSKDTVLLLDKRSARAACIVKIGFGSEVDLLLSNEASWLSRIASEPTLRTYVPRLAVARSSASFNFIAQDVMHGDLEPKLRAPHFFFLQRFQDAFQRSIAYRQSNLFNILQYRFSKLRSRLSQLWVRRFTRALERVTESMSGLQVAMVAAHNDFAPWNIRVNGPIASVFDWEYAADEHFPLFDPLHFVLKPLALNRRPPKTLYEAAIATLHECERGLGAERCYRGETQILAYLVNLCMMFLWADNGEDTADPMVECYGKVIDYMCE